MYKNKLLFIHLHCRRLSCNNCVWLTLIKIRKNTLIWQRWDKERCNITRLICYQVVDNVGKYMITMMTGERLGSHSSRQSPQPDRRWKKPSNQT